MRAISVIVTGAALSCLLFYSCSEANRENAVVAGGTVPAKNALLSSAAAGGEEDSARKFIRTADIKFRVENVEQATYRIEDITADMGGFVTYTRLASNETERDVIPVSADSSIETIKYTVANNITLRVPNARLDTTLKVIAQLVDYLDYREIKADDVALQIKANKWMQKRANGSEGHLEAVLDKSGKLKETIQGTGVLNNIREQADEAALANLSLHNQVNFSTVSIGIYQTQNVKRWIIARGKDVTAYEPGLPAKIWEALKSGWALIEYILIAIAHIWALIVLAFAGYILFRHRSRLKWGKYR